MTSKAKYIGRYVDKYDRDSVELEYEYRGETYWVHIHNTKGNEPLAWQHRNAQAQIDKELELREKIKENHEPVETFGKSLDYFFRMLDEL